MKPTSNRKRSIMGLIAVVITLLIVAGCYAVRGAEESGEASEVHSEGETAVGHADSQGEVEMPHVHGLGFSADGQQLFVAAHDGFRVFADGEWLIPDLPAHDYMGYVATDNGFYSSGHPHPSAGLVNPLGLVKSNDGGQTLTQLGFEGESDFHLMGVGYKNHAVYVLNPTPNSKLLVGMHYSLDDGKIWKQSALQGMTGEPIQLAVHPLEANRVAVATESGLFFSADYGDTFERVAGNNPVTTASFSPDGDSLWFSYQELYSYDLGSEQIRSLTLPEISVDDAIAYLAVNPVQADEIVLATFQRDIYLSQDGGQSWQQIAWAGKGKS